VWTVAVKISFRELSSEECFTLAETHLARAARDCDKVGKSYASLALAHCRLRDAGFPPMSVGKPLHGSGLSPGCSARQL